MLVTSDIKRAVLLNHRHREFTGDSDYSKYYNMFYQDNHQYGFWP